MTVVFTLTGGPFWDDWILDRRAVTTQAMPLSVEPTGLRINHRRVFHVSYTFLDAAGKVRFSATGTDSPALLSQARTKAPLAIEYDPHRPERSRLRDHSASALGLIILFPLGFALAGALIVALGVRRALWRRHVYVHGQSVQATVTAVAATSMRVNRQRVMRVEYVFDTIMGQTRGRTTSRTPPAVGTAIWVLYDESDPGRNIAA